MFEIEIVKTNKNVGKKWKFYSKFSFMGHDNHLALTKNVLFLSIKNKDWIIIFSSKY